MCNKTMLKLLKVIVYITAFLINAATRFLKVKENRVVFISYFMDKPEGNYKVVTDKLIEQGDYEIIYLLKKYDKTPYGKLRYFLSMLKQAFYFNTSRVVILDANCIVMKAIIQKKKTKVIQIWHACGAFKKFGEDTNRMYSVRTCDYAISSGSKVSDIYSRALRISKENVLALGAPRTDALFDSSKVKSYGEKIYGKHGISGKKLLLYAPTFRGRGIDDLNMLEIDLKALADRVKDKYTVAVRLHPMVSGYTKPDGVIDLGNDDLIEVLSATDLLITDYSSIMFDFTILERPMVFYTPDLEQYKEERGFYLDYEEFVPGTIARDFDTLIEAIHKPEFELKQIQEIKKQYFDIHDGFATERMAKFIAMLKDSMSNPLSSDLYIEQIYDVGKSSSH